MPPESFRLVARFSLPPATLRDGWLDGERHARMTGGGATGSGAVGAPFTAWDGYIEGTTLEVGPDRVVQAWRTSEFPDGAPDSRLTLSFAPAEDGGTELTLEHADLPEGQGDAYRQGWEDHYFAPMRAWDGR